MKFILPTILLLLAGLVPGPGQTAPAAFEAEFEMASGEKASGVIRSVEGQSMELELRLPGIGSVKSTTAFKQVKRATFRHLDKVNAALENSTEQRGNLLAAEWNRWKPLAALPESPAPELGLAYAQILITRRDAPGARAVLQQLARESWDPKVAEISKSRLQLVDLLEGNSAEVLAKARKILGDTVDLALRSEANLLVGQAARDELAVFLRENPRWEQDPLARPEYHRLSNLALDSFLQPPLFDGRNLSAMARGLLAAAQVYALLDKPGDARQLSEDLQRFCPGSIEAAQAKTAFLPQIPPTAP